MSTNPHTLVLGATGKTGSRVAARLRARGFPVSAGVNRLVLLSGRGEDAARVCERIVQRALGRESKDSSAFVRDNAASDARGVRS